jgi:release factor glutamine methyltransferase
MTYENLQKSFLESSSLDLESRERLAVFWIMIFHVNHWSRIKYEMHKKEIITTEKQESYIDIIQRLETSEPIQYITGSTEFYGNTHLVNTDVLIPRPETEELVDWIVSDQKTTKNQKYLDIGTGSGCIINSLALNLNGTFTGYDFSNLALSTAKSNAKALKSDVTFKVEDILQSKLRGADYDVIVSNPPYIPFKDKIEMKSNVLEYEPEIALFVSNEDPLIFYKAILNFCLLNLSKSGTLYFEIHEDYKEELKAIVEEEKYSCQFRKDMQGRARMLKIWNLV